MQEALIKAFGALGRFHEGAPFRPWLLRIVANETHNFTRSASRRGARERLAESLTLPLRPPTDDDPEVRAALSESRAALAAALSQLPESMGRVVTCRYLLDLSEAETAMVLNVPRGTVKSRLNRALAKLNALMSPDFVEGTRGGPPCPNR